MTIRTPFESIHCNLCGVQFALPERLLGLWRKSGRPFHCPNGHVQYFDPPVDPESVESIKRNAEMLGGEVVELKGSLVDARAKVERLEAQLEGRERP